MPKQIPEAANLQRSLSPPNTFAISYTLFMHSTVLADDNSAAISRIIL